MQWGQRVRARLLSPLIAVLKSLGVTANMLTYLGVVVGLAAAPFLVMGKGVGLALVAVHVALDGLDGPLARARGDASPRGSFTDTFADQTVIAATTAALAYDGTVGVVAGFVYVFSYTLVVGFAMVRNALNIPYSWLVRPRFFVYAWIAVEWWLAPGVFDWLLWLFSALLLLKTATGFVAIRRRMSGGPATARDRPGTPGASVVEADAQVVEQVFGTGRHGEADGVGANERRKPDAAADTRMPIA